MARQRRRKFQEEPEHHERWIISYADFITLLFAFFVVMYGISSVSESKYRELSESLGQAFTTTNNAESAQTGPNVGTNVVALDTLAASEIKPIKLESEANANLNDKERLLSETIIREQEQLNQVSAQFQETLDTYIQQKLVNVKNHDFWIELEMNSELLFMSGEAEISKRAIPIIKKVAELVRDMPNMISVEGYTDNQPINTVAFKSNWNLASARATSVVKQLVDENINPARLSAVGYGEFHPVADNATTEGRFKNRRVVLLLMSRVFSRYGIDDTERARLLKLDTTLSVESLKNTLNTPDAPAPAADVAP